MMENLRLWLIALVVTAFLIAAAERITPESGAKKLQRLASGLLLLIVLLRPLTGEPAADLCPPFRRFQEETERLTELYTQENRSRTEVLIREKAEAYIETRAAEAGLSLRAEVFLCQKEEVPEIGQVILYGPYNAEFESSVSAALGLDEGSITWEEGDE